MRAINTVGIKSQLLTGALVEVFGSAVVQEPEVTVRRSDRLQLHHVRDLSSDVLLCRSTPLLTARGMAAPVRRELEV